MKKQFFFFIISLTLLNNTWAGKESYIVKERVDIPAREKALNFGIVYVAQWSTYYFDQKRLIEKVGSLENWATLPFKPDFDDDHLDYNIVRHSFAGASYYLWYRSRGHSELGAFGWSTISSLAFEFTVETVTERPSIQDIYQTPVFGFVLGKGLEHTSRYFHSLDNWYGHFFGYVFNPFTLLPRRKDKGNAMTMTPILNKEAVGARVTYEFK